MSDIGLKFGESITPGDPGANKHSFFMPSLNYPLLAEFDHGGTTWYYSKIFGMWLSADYTLSNVSTAQKAFNGSTNGAITLPANSAYEFEARYMITNTGTTSHTWAVLFAGTATYQYLDFEVRGRSGATSPATLAADSSNFQNNGSGASSALPTTALVATAASTSATEQVLLDIKGVLRVGNTGGTFIPQIQLSAATGTAATMKRGSGIKMTPIGSDTAVTLGNWS